ncbi:retinol dehydrogenase 14-like [Amphiura filiformis]|uniref:retinol dehydrogenase 14-like n=1 Tax=Amphiura filiformis TaxID=82378 RepID=UPI003B20E981
MGGKLTYPRDEIPADKTFIVTGGNTGVGYQTAKGIAKLGGRVIIACRSEERATQALEKMQKEHREEVKQERQTQDEAAKKANPPPAATKDTPKPPATGDKDTTGEGSGDKDTAEASATKDTGDASAEGQTTEAKEENEPIASADKEDSPPPEDDAADDVQPLKVEFMKLDLASLASTMEFINAYKAKGYPLHVLICNAGLGLVPFQKTDDGFELQFQVNYLSHFLMTLHLLPLLRESDPNSRIINLTSIVHTSGTFDLKNMQGELSYDRIKFYGNSKVYQIMNMYALNRRLKDSGISIFSVHPGYVDSEFSRGSADSKLHSFVESVSQVLHIKRNVEDGAMTSLVAALDTSYDGRSALYLKDCKVANASALARNTEKQEQLWDYSLDCIKDHITEDLLKDLHLPVPAAKDDTPTTDEAKGEAETKPETPNKSEEPTSTQDEAKSKSEEEVESKPEEKTESKEEVEESKADEDDKSKVEEVESKPEEDIEAKPEAESESKVDEKEEEKKEESEDQSPTDEGGDTKTDEEEVKSEEVKGDEDKGQEDGEGE